MHSEWIVRALAFVTLGIVIIFAAVHYGRFLKEPANRSAAANVAAGGKAATTQVHEDAPDGSYHDRPLKERLDASSACAHPYDPDLAKRPLQVRTAR